MKNLNSFLAITMISFLFACKKDNVKENVPLTGKWKLVAQYVSTGPPGSWQNVSGKEAPQYASFNSDSTIVSPLFSEYATFIIKDSVTIKFTKKGSDDFQYYRFQIKKDVLEMSPAGPLICIEGCAIRLVKQK